ILDTRRPEALSDGHPGCGCSVSVADPRRRPLCPGPVREGSSLPGSHCGIVRVGPFTAWPPLCTGLRSDDFVPLRFDFGAMVVRPGRHWSLLHTGSSARLWLDVPSGRANLRIRQYVHVPGGPAQLPCHIRRIRCCGWEEEIMHLLMMSLYAAITAIVLAAIEP